MAEFGPAIDATLQHEGGYVNNPADPGGETKYGISKNSFPDEDIRNLTVDRAKQLYYRDWWSKGFGQLASQSVANKVFDLSVNMQRYGNHGPAIEILQKAVCDCGGSVAVDGVLGPRTIAVANEVPEDTLLAAIKEQAVAHYQRLVANRPTLAQFLPGWTKRAEA